jgi:hypothetical protein
MRSRIRSKHGLTTQIVDITGRTTVIVTVINDTEHATVTKTVIIPNLVSHYGINHVALSVTGKTAAHGNILQKNVRSQEPSSKLLIETSSTNSTITLINDLISILQTSRTTILTRKKNLKKFSKH